MAEDSDDKAYIAVKGRCILLVTVLGRGGTASKHLVFIEHQVGRSVIFH